MHIKRINREAGTDNLKILPDLKEDSGIKNPFNLFPVHIHYIRNP